MRFAAIIGVFVLAGPVAAGLTGPRAAPAPLAAAAHCTGPFARVPSPSPGQGDNIQFATAASGADDMWSVGRQLTGNDYQNLILHNGGHGWSVVPAPNPGPGSFDQLTAVSASGPADAWASGSFDTGNSDIPFDPQALHWDGTSWTAEPLPALPGEFDSDTSASIVDISPTDAWLVGAYLNSSGADVSIVAHWDGTAWSLVSHPAAAVALTAVAASGPGDVWAVGVGAGPSFPAVIEHYNGSTWTVSATLPGISLSGVTSIGPARAWAVGTAGKSQNATATVEWNGSSWNVVPSPNVGAGDGLRAVSAVAGGGVWAVGDEGDFATGVGHSQPIAMHWNGTAWTTVQAIGVGPDTDGFTGAFFGVAAVTATRVVAVGEAVGQSQSLVADLCPFTVRDTGLIPSAARLSGPGAAAYWVIPKSDAASHELADGSGFGLFDSGTKAPGSSYAFAFPASGTWVVRDSSDGAGERVSVPILVLNNLGGRPGLQWADASPPTGARFEVQDIPPGGTTFTRFRNTTAEGRLVLGKRLPPGTYEFRSRMRNPATGAATGWSPTVSVTVPAPSGPR
jgi:hypothetical protein